MVSLEYTLIGIVIIIQLIVTVRIFLKIQTLGQVFKNPLTVEPKETEEGNRIHLTYTSSKNPVALRIENAINNYLISNHGHTVNFPIIKDIIDREIETKDDEISNGLPTPLYLGLAGTMIGIIIGLFSIPAIGGKIVAGINILIDGVKIAMVASLLGVVLTTILTNVFYSPAQKKVQTQKNQLLSYLQARLLPELIKAEETGFTRLQESLDTFNRSAATIATNIENATNKIDENIRKQEAIISTIEKIDVSKVSSINLELFNRIEENMGALVKFSEYTSTLSRISEKLENFSERTLDIEQVVGKINDNLDRTTKLQKFLSAHFELLEEHGEKVNQAVDHSSKYYQEGIDSLKEDMEERRKKLDEFFHSMENELNHTTQEIVKKLDSATNEHLQRVEQAYENATPKFNQLENLKELPPLKSTFQEISGELQNTAKTGNEKILQKLHDISSQLNGNNPANAYLGEFHKSIQQLNKHFENNQGFTNKREKPFYRWLKTGEMVLRIIAWTGGISFLLYYGLQHFQII